jgi:3-hydroxyisobutyrate dehydrogenase
MVERVGFIGLGDMGEPMARNLCGGAFEVSVFDLRAEVTREVAATGAHPAASAREVGERSEVVGICVIDDVATEAVVEEVLAGAAPGTILAIHGTVSPALVHRLGAHAEAAGCELVDAQVTGGRDRASEHQLRYMVGGSDAAVARCRPVFETSAAEVTHCGPLGSGAVAKLCNNLVQFQAWHGYLEAAQLADAAGLPREKLLEVLSWIMNDNARAFLAGRSALVAHPELDVIRERFTAVAELARKDLQLALDVAAEHDLPMRLTQRSLEQVEDLFGVLGGGSDRSKRR